MTTELACIRPPTPDGAQAPIVVFVPRDVIQRQTERYSLTVADVVSLYLAEQSRHFRQGENFDRMKQYVQSFADRYGAKPVSECLQRDLDLWILATPKWKSPHTKRQAMFRVVSCFLWAEESRLIEFCPYHVPSYARSRKRSGKLPNFLREEEIEAMMTFASEQLARARTGTKRYGPNQRKIDAARRDLMLVQLGLFAGLRCSEIAKLMVEDVDFAGRQIFISQSKGGKDRYVPIAARLFNPLREWIGERKAGFVVPGPRGGRFPHVTIYFRIARLARLMKLGRKFSPHALRHSCASSLRARGADIRLIQEVLGHKDVSTTMIYTHIETRHLREAMDRL